MNADGELYAGRVASERGDKTGREASRNKRRKRRKKEKVARTLTIAALSCGRAGGRKIALWRTAERAGTFFGIADSNAV